MRRWPTRWLDRLLVVVVCLPFVHCLWRRTVVTRPAASVLVVDAGGRPVAGADVVVYWWSYPHHQFHQRFVERTGPDGRAVFAGATRRETIAPLCMHGVPQHEHTVCVDVPGTGRGSVQLERSGQEVTVALAPGAAANGLDDCARFARIAAGEDPDLPPSGTDAGGDALTPR